MTTFESPTMIHLNSILINLRERLLQFFKGDYY